MYILRSLWFANFRMWQGIRCEGFWPLWLDVLLDWISASVWVHIFNRASKSSLEKLFVSVPSSLQLQEENKAVVEKKTWVKELVKIVTCHLLLGHNSSSWEQWSIFTTYGNSTYVASVMLATLNRLLVSQKWVEDDCAYVVFTTTSSFERPSAHFGIYSHHFVMRINAVNLFMRTSQRYGNRLYMESTVGKSLMVCSCDIL